MNNRGRNYIHHVLVAMLVAALVIMACVPMSLAYYELTPVQITLSSTNVDVAAGKTHTITCKVDPASERQLPGCGMEECPTVCGEGCLNAKGWCTCAGTTYETYCTSVTATSSSVKVAKASYSGGVLKITGESAGTALITVTAKLAKHVDSEKTIRVTVTGSAASPAAGTDSSEGAGSSSSSSSSSSETSSSSSSKDADKKGMSSSKGGTSAGGTKSSKLKKGTSTTSVGSESASAPLGADGTSISKTSVKSTKKAEKKSEDKDGNGTDYASTKSGVTLSTDLSQPVAEVLSTFDITGEDVEQPPDSLLVLVLIVAALVFGATAVEYRRLKKDGRI